MAIQATFGLFTLGHLTMTLAFPLCGFTLTFFPVILTLMGILSLHGRDQTLQYCCPPHPRPSPTSKQAR